jgi:light-regulated signal transduction histidine kinase (bacteriophytochrome)
MQVLAPFEMTRRGFQEAIEALRREIVARRQAELRLRKQAEELARSNEELERFAYAASHDLQEPLRTVISHTQLLAERYRGKLDADADDFIGFAVDGAKRMSAMISGLLQYSRVRNAEAVAEPSDCEAVLGRVLANLRVAVEESGAEVTHDALPVVQGNATLLEQLLQNLIGNAIKFRAAHPTRVHVSAVQQNGEWLFSVRDNGIGIHPDHAERIFVVFQRLHTREEYPGAGIGLAIARRIVEQHGGRLWVESEPGNGATFYFTLPAAAEQRAAA